MSQEPHQSLQSNFLTVRIDSQGISFDDFWEIQRHISIILDEVDRDLFKKNRKAVRWDIEETTKGSLMLILLGSPANRGIGADVVPALIKTVKSGISKISDVPERPEHFTDKALKSLEFLSKKRGSGKIRALQLGSESGLTDITINIAPNVDELIGARHESYGSVEGMLEGINIHGDPYFEIYSLLDDKPIKAYFSRKLIDNAILLLGKRVYTYGTIRSRNDGTRISISVEEIEAFPDESDLPSIEEMAGIWRHEVN